MPQGLCTDEDCQRREEDISAFTRGLDAFQRLKREPLVSIDTARLDRALSGGAVGNQLSEILDEYSDCELVDGKFISLILHSLAGLMISHATEPSKEVWNEVRPVSLAPASDPATRRGCRILAMVHELHKAGYQGIRAFGAQSQHSPHWFCYITDAHNEGRWNFRLVSCSNRDANFFGWTDVAHASARELAQRFIHRFPDIAHHGAIEDWAYAGWFGELLSKAEHGHLPVAMTDFEFDWRDIAPPPPPKIDWVENETDIPAPIPSEILSLERMPYEDEPVYRLEMFALSFDGYEQGLDIPALAKRKEEVVRDLKNSMIQDIRLAMFYVQRQMKWSDGIAPPALISELRRLVAELRARVGNMPHKP